MLPITCRGRTALKRAYAKRAKSGKTWTTRRRSPRPRLSIRPPRRFCELPATRRCARELAAVASEVTKAKFELVRLGSLDDLAAIIRRVRAQKPEGEKELFPSWQGMQYMHGMFSGLAKLEPLDNSRYSNIPWTSAREVIEAR